VILRNLTNCTLIMKSNPITVHATHLENCSFFAGPVQTSIYLEHCNDCQLSLACQQLRAHNSKNTAIYLHVTSKGIIEDCNGIQVITTIYEPENTRAQDPSAQEPTKNRSKKLVNLFHTLCFVIGIYLLLMTWPNWELLDNLLNRLRDFLYPFLIDKDFLFIREAGHGNCNSRS
jgi:hypothetical protein